MEERTIGKFRGRLFGGFNRKDVVEYIQKSSEGYEKYRQEYVRLTEKCADLEAKLFGADEREKALRLENNKLTEQLHFLKDIEKRAQEIQNELDAIRESAKVYEDTKQRIAQLELDSVMRAASIENAAVSAAESTLDRTDALLCDLGVRYENVKSDVEVTVAHLRGELDKISASLENLVSVLEKSEEEFASFKDKAFAAREIVLPQKG